MALARLTVDAEKMKSNLSEAERTLLSVIGTTICVTRGSVANLEGGDYGAKRIHPSLGTDVIDKPEKTTYADTLSPVLTPVAQWSGMSLSPTSQHSRATLLSATLTSHRRPTR